MCAFSGCRTHNSITIQNIRRRNIPKLVRRGFSNAGDAWCSPNRKLLTKFGRIVVHRALQLEKFQIRDNVMNTALINAFAVCEHVNVVEQIQNRHTWLVNGAYDGTTLVCQVPQYLHALFGRYTVQPTTERDKNRQYYFRSGTCRSVEILPREFTANTRVHIYVHLLSREYIIPKHRNFEKVNI